MSSAAAHGPLLVEIQGHSLDDGPGIRSVVYLKGCPLACPWCHNPEARHPRPELAFDASRCVGHRACVAACQPRALDPAHPFFVDRTRCTLCEACVEACPSGAFSIVGVPADEDAILERLARYETFHHTSGGGVTFSGGEPLLHPELVGALCRRLRPRGIGTLVETCGLFDLERYRSLVEPHLDQVYVDLKLVDDDEHREHLGVGNRPILANLAALVSRANAGGVPVLPRIPLIPGITATDRNLSAASRLLRELGARRVQLLPYNPLWRDKVTRIGATARYARTTWMTPGEIAAACAHFAGFEIVA